MREAETGRIVVARVEVANTAWKRTIGLLGRSELAANTGLWLSPCNGIHTLGMRFPMDVLFLDTEGKLLRQVTNLKPWRFCGPVRGARTVVELPAGTLAALQLRPGYHYLLAGPVGNRRSMETVHSR